MSTYFFHLRGGVDVLIDEEGRKLASMEAVIAAALTEARAIIGADALAGVIRLDLRIDVEDELGVIVHRLQFDDAVQLVPARLSGRS